MHIFHKWSKWKQIREGTLEKKILMSGEAIEYGNYMDQERECLDCGKKLWNRQEVSTR